MNEMPFVFATTQPANAATLIEAPTSGNACPRLNHVNATTPHASCANATIANAITA